MVKIAITELEFRKAESIFTRAVAEGLACVSAPADEKALAELIRSSGARHVIIGVERYEQSLYEALPTGAVIARFGVGHDGVNKPLATAKGLLCANTPGALDDSVAEHAVNLLLAASRHTVTVGADLRAGRWSPHGRRAGGCSCSACWSTSGSRTTGFGTSPAARSRSHPG